MRVLLILFPFLLAIGGLVFLQTGLFAPDATPRPTAEVAPPPAMALSDVTQVVARLPSDQATGLTRPVPRPAAASGSGNDELQDLTMNVLAGLGMIAPPAEAAAAPTAAAATGPESEMQTLTMAVLNGLSGISTNTTPEPVPENLPLADLVSRAVSQGQSDAYLDAVLNEAADSGQIAIPGALRTSDGRVDTDALLRALILANSGGALAQIPDDVIPSGQGVEVRVVQEAGETVPYYFYTVQPGDSLGAIAQNFYGDAAFYKVIFEANRRLLSTPDRIKSGQRLRIPTNG